jgi:hypothetical protein
MLATVFLGHVSFDQKTFGRKTFLAQNHTLKKILVSLLTDDQMTDS